MTSEPQALVQDVETLGVETLEFLASRVGVATLAAIFAVLLGESTQELVEPLSEFVGQLAQDVLAVLGPDKVKAALARLYAAADKIADAAENAKFPP